MFETLGDFSIAYFSLGTILILLVLFEKKLIEIEERWFKK